jgi:hypothetical protein
LIVLLALAAFVGVGALGIRGCFAVVTHGAAKRDAADYREARARVYEALRSRPTLEVSDHSYGEGPRTIRAQRLSSGGVVVVYDGWTEGLTRTLAPYGIAVRGEYTDQDRNTVRSTIAFVDVDGDGEADVFRTPAGVVQAGLVGERDGFRSLAEVEPMGLRDSSRITLRERWRWAIYDLADHVSGAGSR